MVQGFLVFFCWPKKSFLDRVFRDSMLLVTPSFLGLHVFIVRWKGRGEQFEEQCFRDFVAACHCVVNDPGLFCQSAESHITVVSCG